MMEGSEDHTRRGAKREVPEDDSEEDEVESRAKAHREHEAQRPKEVDTEDLRECNHIISTMDYEYEMEIFKYDQGFLYKFDMNGDQLNIKEQCINCQTDMFAKMTEEMKKSMHMVILRYCKLCRITQLIYKEREQEVRKLMNDLKDKEFADCLYGNMNEASIIIDCIKKIKDEFPDIYNEYSNLMTEVSNEMNFILKKMVDMQQCIKEDWRTSILGINYKYLSTAFTVSR